jgi:hypothetical protein
MMAWTSISPFAGNLANRACGTHVADAITMRPRARSTATTDQVA